MRMMAQLLVVSSLDRAIRFRDRRMNPNPSASGIAVPASLPAGAGYLFLGAVVLGGKSVKEMALHLHAMLQEDGEASTCLAQALIMHHQYTLNEIQAVPDQPRSRLPNFHVRLPIVLHLDGLLPMAGLVPGTVLWPQTGR